MKLDANNNGRIIYRIARSNLTDSKVYTLFSGLTIILSITFIMVMSLFLQGTQTAEERMLQNMQHVLYMNVPRERMEELAADERTELVIPYKDSGAEFETSGVNYKLIYMKSQKDKIQTYVPAEGKEPEKYNEIVVDKSFLNSIGKECRIGERLSLNTENGAEEFVVCGYTGREQELSSYTVYVSEEFAEKNPSMRAIEYTALARIAGAQDMESSGFESAVYQIAEDYGVKRQNVNINGKFEESLRGDHTAGYAIAFVSLFIMAASGIVIYSIFYLSVSSRTRQIGQLQTIGMTEKQLRKMVRREGVFSDAEYMVSYQYNAHDPSAYGPTDMQLKGHLSEELKKRLSRLPHVRSVRTENSVFGSIEYQGAVWSDGFYRLTRDSDAYFQMNAEGNNSYDYLCESDGIMITDSEFVSGINGISPQVGDFITLHWSDGAEHTAKLKIAAVSPDPAPVKGGYNFAMTDQTMEKLWGDMNTISAFYISVEDYETYGEQTEEAIRSLTEDDPDLSLATLREQILDDSANVKRIKMQIYGIAAFVTLFGILNLINMMIGNIATRKRELSVLESIGMEVKQIRNMLFWESVMYVFPAILVTLFGGGAAGYGFISGGEKQRTAVARALMNQPYVILADEPTGNLDSKSCKAVIDAFLQAKREMGATIFMVTHDSFAASFCDRVIVLKDGQVYGELKRKGTRREFMDGLLDTIRTLGGDGDDNE